MIGLSALIPGKKTLVVAGLFALAAGAVWLQTCRLEKCQVREELCNRAVATCKAQARIYDDWRKVDAETSKKIKSVVGGDVRRTVSALNELFGQVPAMPAAPGPAGGAGKTKRPIRGP